MGISASLGTSAWVAAIAVLSARATGCGGAALCGRRQLKAGCRQLQAGWWRRGGHCRHGGPEGLMPPQRGPDKVATVV